MADRTCAVPGCTRPLVARGWCNAHYLRWTRFGDVQADRPLRDRQRNFQCTGCSVKDCSARHFAKGLCKRHYQRQQQGRPLEGPFLEQKFHRGDPCIVGGCGRPSWAAGLCPTHQSRLWRRGTTAAPEPPTADEIEQRRQHRREYLRDWKAAEYHRDPERVKQRRKQWIAAHPDAMAVLHRRKLAKRRQVRSIRFTGDQLRAKVEYWADRCWICGGVSEAIDHVKPVSKGGINMLANLRPICRSCNSRKSGHWPMADVRAAFLRAGFDYSALASATGILTHA